MLQPRGTQCSPNPLSASPCVPALGPHPSAKPRDPALKEALASTVSTHSASTCAQALGLNPCAKPLTPTLKDTSAPDAFADGRRNPSALPSVPTLGPNPGAKPHTPKSVGGPPQAAVASETEERRITGQDGACAGTSSLTAAADPNPTLGPNPGAKPRNPKVNGLDSGFPEANQLLR